AAVLDEPLRLRPGSRRTAVLARPAPDQSGGAGEIFQRRGGRCIAFQLPARQRAADLDESAVAAGVCGAVSVIAKNQNQGKLTAGGLLVVMRAADSSDHRAVDGNDLSGN